MAETRLSVHVYDSLQYQTVQFLSCAYCLKVLRSSADLYSYTTVCSVLRIACLRR